MIPEVHLQAAVLEGPDAPGLTAKADIEGGGESPGAAVVHPAREDGVDALHDQPDMAGVDGPWPANGRGDVPAVHDELAEQDAQGRVRSDRLAAVEPVGGNVVAIAFDLRAHRGHVAPESVGQLIH